MATLVSKFRITAGFKCPEEKGMPRERTESPYEVWNNQLGVPISLERVQSHFIDGRQRRLDVRPG